MPATSSSRFCIATSTTLDPANGHFGTDGFSSFENETQDLKIPHLRNLYQKVGMFGMPSVSDFINPGNNGFQGPQVRGFGFLHDGSIDTLFRFHNATVFNQSGINPGGFASGAAGDTQRRDVEQFMLAFDSDMKPAMTARAHPRMTRTLWVAPSSAKGNRRSGAPPAPRRRAPRGRHHG